MSEYARVLAEALRRDALRDKVRPFLARATGWMEPAVHRAPAPAPQAGGGRPASAPDWRGVTNMVSDEEYLSPADRVKRAIQARDPALEELFYDMKMKKQMQQDAAQAAQTATALKRREVVDSILPNVLAELFSGGK